MTGSLSVDEKQSLMEETEEIEKVTTPIYRAPEQIWRKIKKIE